MKKQLTWSDLRKLGRSDNGSNFHYPSWYPNADIASYFDHIRAPSRAWPHSYAKAAQTQKFYKWLKENRADLCLVIGE